MKKNLLFGAKNFLVKVLLTGILSHGFIGMLNGQVNFPQTTNADFNKGVLNGLVVQNDNVELQYAASGVSNWLTTTVLPQTLSGHKTVTWNNQYVYLVGGYNNATYSNSVYYASIYSGGIYGWNTLPSLPSGIKDPAVVIGTNTIYVLGGRNATQVFNTIYYAAINTDGTIGYWQTSTVTLPTALWGHTAVYLNGYIYVAGGSNVTTENTALNTVYFTKVKADNSISAFSTGTSLPVERNKHSMVTYNRKIYILGGYDNSGTKSGNVYFATPGTDGTTGPWSDGTPLPLAISNHSSVVANGLIMVIAGAINTAPYLSNTVYYANIDQALPWTWITGSSTMYDFTKDGSAFHGNGVVINCGGTNLSGAPIVNSRYTNLVMTSNYVNHGVFISNPYYELGAERVIDSLTFHSTYDPSFSNCQVSYRTALSNGDWSEWIPFTSTSPVYINLTRQYLQYSVIFTSQNNYNIAFHDMTLSTQGTGLCGNLNGITTFTKAQSPYWATCDISFTGGTHTFEAGATILFLPGTGLSVSQANIICNGTEADSVKFLYYTSGTGLWNGIYFDPNSDAGVSSQFNYTIIADAGNGGNNANLYCNQTSEPFLQNCNIRNANGDGIRLYYSNLILQNTVIKGNTENGIYLDMSNPTYVSCAISYNGGAGVYLTNTSSTPTYSGTTIDHNLYGFHYPSPNFTFTEPFGSPNLTNNTYNGIAMDGGDINGANRTWNTIPYDYILLGSVRIVQGGGNVRLTIEPGNKIKSKEGVQIKIGDASGCYYCYHNGGELYAIGTPDSMITFTSYNGLAGGWNGIYFTDYSDIYVGQSQFDYCKIENGNDFNIYAESTSQPNQINHCIIKNAVLDGIKYNYAGGSIINSQFINNGNYPLNIMHSGIIPYHGNNSYIGNGKQYIAFPGGDYNYNLTLNFDAIPYHILGDIRLVGGPRLTVKPGVTLSFATGKNIRIGEDWSWSASLWAEGKTDSIITFKPFNDSIGGWGGIKFYDGSDYNGATSLMKYCKVQKAANFSLYAENSTQPHLKHCEFTQTTGIGIQCNNSSLTIDSCTISNSAGIGVNLSQFHGSILHTTINNSGSHGLVGYYSDGIIHNCQFLNNNGYPLKYMDWTCNFHLSGNTFIGNNPNYIAIAGGDYYEDRTLYNDGIGYHILGNIRVLKGSSHSRLTIKPGLTLAFSPGKYLQVGVDGGYGGDLYAEGKADSIITFKPVNDSVGGWGGIYFHPHSDDYGSTSSLKYCKIEKAASNNIYCNATNQPQIKHCVISQSSGVGVQLTSSSPTFDSCTINNSGSHGITETSSSASIQHSIFFNNNGYPLKYEDWPCNSYLKGNTYTGNTINYIGISGGDYYENRTFYNDGIPYHVLGDIRIIYPRITIKPGVTLAFSKGKNLRLGEGWNWGGSLWAEGKADSIITFKPFNDSVGGWSGLVFYDGSDYNGTSSSMKYCKVEKALNNNLLCENTNQPELHNCEFAYSGSVNLQLNASSLVIDSCIIRNAGANGLVGYPINGPIHHCQFLTNNGYPLYFSQAGIEPDLLGCTFVGNTINYLALAGGDYWESKTLRNYGIGYHVLDNIRILKNNGNSRLTIQPGLTLAFNPGKYLQVGENNSYGGELYAIGTPDSIITFKPINEQTGGWNGIYFNNYNDQYGGISYLQYCKIEKGVSYNLYCESSNQPYIANCEFKKSAAIGIIFSSSSPLMESSIVDSSGTLGMQLNSSSPQIKTTTIDNSGTIGIQLNSSSPVIDSCTITNSGSHGIVEQSSAGQIRYCNFLNNSGYPLKYNDWNCNSHLFGNIYSGNTPNYIGLSGGDYWENRTFYNDGIPYHVLDNIRIMCSRITIKPGVTMAFAPSKKVQVGVDYYGCSMGLYAEGTSDSLITFKPYNNSIGGWGGVYFHDCNDNWGGTSSLKYCNVEKGAINNILCESSSQPTLEHCMLTQSAGNGLKLYYSNIPTIKNSSFTGNTLNGIMLEGNSYPNIGNDTSFTCNLFNNGSFDLYNNTGYNINARYNYWASCDSTMITSHIYDKTDNGSLGTVYFNPFACVPSLLTDSTSMTGTVKYANSLLSPMKNASLVIKNFGGTTIASTTTNTSGIYDFPPFPSGNYQMFITPSDPWGGVNGTDALLILNHFVQAAPLTGMKLAAADVNKSAYANATDALFVKGRFVGQLSSFPSGDFLYDSEAISINGNHVTNDMKMLCFGDVNASFAPTLKNNSPVTLAHESSITVPSFTEFYLPVRMKYGSETGAISLGFYYPEEYFEINGVELKNGSINVSYKAENGLFRMAWCDLKGMIINDEETIVTLKVRSLDLSGLTENLTFGLYENSELADISGTVVDDVVLEIPEIKLLPDGINDPLSGFYLTVYPNPFKDQCTVNFTLSQQSSVKIALYNNLGDQMNHPDEANYPIGNHQVKLNAPNLTPGLYLLKIEIASVDKTYSKIMKVVVSN